MIHFSIHSRAQPTLPNSLLKLQLIFIDDFVSFPITDKAICTKSYVKSYVNVGFASNSINYSFIRENAKPIVLSYLV